MNHTRKLALLLAMLILLQVAPFLPHGMVSAGTYDTSTPYYDGTYSTRTYSASEWSQMLITYNIPSNTQSKNTKGLPFNIELWIEKGIIVYGDYASVSSTKNDFKNATGDLNAEGKYIETPNKGYYNGGTGEYRYHGHDVNHSLYANGDFPIDANSGMKATAKNWIYRIWDITNPYYKNTRIENASDYNKIAMGDIGNDAIAQTYVQKWINEGLPFELSTSNNTDKNAYNYAHVLTAPTTRQTGEVQMYHLSYYDGKPWYQIFSLDQIKEKEITPVDAKIEIIGKDSTAEGGYGSMKYTLTVSGKLLDDAFFNDDVLKTTKYTREDISSWSMELTDTVTGVKQTLVGKRTAKESGSAEFTVLIPYSSIEPMISVENPTFSPSFTGKATAIFTTGDKSSDTDVIGDAIDLPIVEEKKPLEINITAPQEMLDTERFKIVASTVGDDFTRTVKLNGTELSVADTDKFLAGNYLFPLIGADRLYVYTITYYDNVRKVQFDFVDYVIVYTTKPKVNATVTGTFKENRLINASPNISGVNSAYLKANASISTILFNATTGSGNDSLIKYGTKTMSNMSFIVKGEEQINIHVQARTTPSRIERSDIPVDYFNSDPYVYQLFTLKDYEPAMLANIWNGTLTRNETLDFVYEAVSTDDDLVTFNTYKILYDADGDGNYETTIKQGNWVDFTPYQPTTLGMYKIVFYAEETFGQPTLPQFITDDDKRFYTLEREFNVDNLAPMTKLYTDIEYAFPQADVIVLNDQTITRELNNSIISERVNWINGLRQSSIEASVQIWDLYTYVYEQDASTTRNTGGSYPPATTSYTSNGYTGILSRYSVTNNRYQVDHGSNQTTTTTTTVSERHYNSGSANYVRNATGWYVSSSYEANGMTQLPSSMSYSSGGYTGTLYKGSGGVYSDTGAPSGGSAGDTYTRHTTWYADYSGTVSKQTTVWVSNWVWYDDYTGYYSGKIYKNVKQSFTPTFRINSDKYLVYFADSAINNMVDIQAIKNRGNVKVILVGKPSTQALLTHDHFIDSSTPLASVMTQINQIIASTNPYENKQLIQVGETFTLHKADIDDENDPIVDIGYQYVHNPNYYDNSMGLESGAVPIYANDTFATALKNSFSKPGHYQIYRKIKDAPVGNPSYSKESNVPRLDVYVHRKPIADFTLEWDYDTASESYKTTWVDNSYDLDHQHTDDQKGIRDRKIMYRKTSGDNVWIYAIPDGLTAGTYELRYTVKDIEGVWSDPLPKSFTLSSEPPIRVYGKLKTENNDFDINALPASESLIAFDLETNYHRTHTLRVKLINAENQTLYQGALNSSTTLPNNNINGNQHLWFDETIPTSATLKDGAYKIRIEATSVAVPVVIGHLDLPFIINTPITVKGELSAMTIGEQATLNATTNKYVSSVVATLHDGTPMQTQVTLSKVGTLDGAGQQRWQATYLVPESVGEGDYEAVFIGTTPSGKSEADRVPYRVDAVSVKSVAIEGYWNHWRGQLNLFGVRMTNAPHRFLGYEKVKIRAEVTGNPERVEVRFSPELEAMRYINSKGQAYDFKDEFGYEVAFPLLMQKVGEGHYEVETILPLTPQTLNFQNERLRAPYFMTVTAVKGEVRRSHTISDIDMTGNIFDMLYVQPRY